MMNSPIIWEEHFKPITSKSVPNVKDGYYISSFGRVYSTFSNNFMNLQATNTGYIRVYLQNVNNKGLYHLVHRIVMIEFCPVPGYENLQVNHINGNKLDNSISNLQWCTCSQNIIHAYNTGLKTCKLGEDCSFCTISNEAAEQVAQLLTQSKYSHKEISQITNVPVYIVSNISAGATWKWLYNKYNLGKYKKPARDKMSDEDLEKLCQYFQNNSHLYTVKTDLFKAALKELFNIEYTRNMSATMSRIYNHKTRNDIVDKYNFEGSTTIES